MPVAQDDDLVAHRDGDVPRVDDHLVHRDAADDREPPPADRHLRLSGRRSRDAVRVAAGDEREPGGPVRPERQPVRRAVAGRDVLHREDPGHQAHDRAQPQVCRGDLLEGAESEQRQPHPDRVAGDPVRTECARRVRGVRPEALPRREAGARPCQEVRELRVEHVEERLLLRGRRVARHIRVREVAHESDDPHLTVAPFGHNTLVLFGRGRGPGRVRSPGHVGLVVLGQVREETAQLCGGEAAAPQSGVDLEVDAGGLRGATGGVAGAGEAVRGGEAHLDPACHGKGEVRRGVVDPEEDDRLLTVRQTREQVVQVECLCECRHTEPPHSCAEHGGHHVLQPVPVRPSLDDRHEGPVADRPADRRDVLREGGCVDVRPQGRGCLSAHRGHPPQSPRAGTGRR